jgi:hypothetical protein
MVVYLNGMRRQVRSKKDLMPQAPASARIRVLPESATSSQDEHILQPKQAPFNVLWHGLEGNGDRMIRRVLQYNSYEPSTQAQGPKAARYQTPRFAGLDGNSRLL